MGLAAAAGLLRCPVCAGQLTVDDRGAGCAERHRFDLARQGYLNLAGAAEPANADSAAMLAARARVQAAGLFAPVLRAVATLVPASSRVVVEVGAGTGYYLAGALPPQSRGVATDVSKAAARVAARHPGVASLVADTWRGLPLRDGVVDVLLCVFAPRNAAEFGRVVAPGGSLIVVTPGDRHLAELRAAHTLLGLDPDKEKRLQIGLATGFEQMGTQRVGSTTQLPADAVADLLAMGPNAFHRVPAHTAAGPVTVDVRVSQFRRH